MEIYCPTERVVGTIGFSGDRGLSRVGYYLVMTISCLSIPTHVFSIHYICDDDDIDPGSLCLC